MDLNNLQINVDTVVRTLAEKIAVLERDNALLIAQREALIEKIEGDGEES